MPHAAPLYLPACHVRYGRAEQSRAEQSRAEQKDEDFFAWRRRQRVSIGNGAIVGGVAAKLIRYRFPRAIAQALKATAWWDWDHATLTAHLPEFKDLRKFLAQYAP